LFSVSELSDPATFETRMSTFMIQQAPSTFERRAFWGASIVLAAVVVSCPVPCNAQTDVATDVPTVEVIEPQLLTRRDPEFKYPDPIHRLPSSFLKLWVEALAGPGQELKRDVSMSIGRAHREKYLDCSPAIDALVEVLNDRTTARSVRVEVARTLITLDARQCSASLKEFLQAGSGTQFELIVEPALAHWNDSEMRVVWQQRLTAGDIPRHRGLLAIRALADLPESMTAGQQLHSDLEGLIKTSRDTAIMLEAARGLGSIKRVDLEPLARKLLFSAEAAGATESLAGVYLLQHHASDASRELLRRVIAEGLTKRASAPVIRMAWRRLLQRDVADLADLAPAAIQHSDPEVRRCAVDTLLRFTSKDGIRLLGQTLDDRHPKIRRAARQGLLQLSAEDSFNEAVRRAGREAVARPSWREQEQAIVLLAVLDQSDAADRMLELLDAPRAEVAIAAAWGLRMLNVAEKQPAMLEHAEMLDQQFRDGQELRRHHETMLAHLFEALGKAKYLPAGPLLKRWVPKMPPQVSFDKARSSAVWSLGWFYEDSKDAALAQSLKARFLDVASLEPESFPVRRAAAIAMGRIGATQMVASLRPFATAGSEEIDMAAAWAIGRMTGETFPRPAPQIKTGNRWKLAPIGSRLKAASVEEERR
jgi:HEAT repeat protein